jgi:hypothetical protein
MEYHQDKYDSSLVENDTSTINHSSDVSFSSQESDDDDYDIAAMVNSITSTNVIVATATTKHQRKGVVLT